MTTKSQRGKYRDRTILTFKRIIKAISSELRFNMLYNYLKTFCKNVKVLYLKVKGSRVVFELSVTY